MLTKEQFDKWLRALESGRYQQGQRGLCLETLSGNFLHCALGVLSMELGCCACVDGRDVPYYPSFTVLSSDMQHRLVVLNDVGPIDQYQRVIEYLKQHEEEFVGG